MTSSRNGARGDLAKIYLSPRHPAGFTTPRRVKAASTGHSFSAVKSYLETQDSYTKHTPVIRHFKRNRVMVTTIDEEWALDLSDFQSIKKENAGFSYVFCCVDTFSKYGWVVCLKNKSAEVVLEALKTIIKKSGRRPTRISTDLGKEFCNAVMRKFLQQENISHITPHNPDIKVSVVERWQLSLKTRLFKAFTHLRTYRYWDKLIHDVVSAMNHTYHRSIKMPPSDVNEKNVLQVYRNLYGFPLREKAVPPKLCVGQIVRIAREVGPFEKGVYGGWSDELYRITHVVPHAIPVYKLETDDGEEIIGSFYARELQPVKMNK